MNQEAESFSDLSALAGLDSDADGRAVGLLDYDQDGWQDFVLINANSPQLEVFQNQIGLRKSGNYCIAFRLVGGKSDAEAGGEWSNRDGYGAIIKVNAGGNSYMREFRCGEGFAAQNSKTSLIGLGKNQEIDSVEVYWPSGKKQVFNSMKVGTINVIHERGEVISTNFKKTHKHGPAKQEAKASFRLPGVPNDKPIVFVTMATWCPSCKKHLSQVELLKKHFSDEYYFFGLPVDPEDTQESFENYVSSFNPSYEILTQISALDREKISKFIYSFLKEDVLPSTIVIDENGLVKLIQKGLPSISELTQISSGYR